MTTEQDIQELAKRLEEKKSYCKILEEENKKLGELNQRKDKIIDAGKECAKNYLLYHTKYNQLRDDIKEYAHSIMALAVENELLRILAEIDKK